MIGGHGQVKLKVRYVKTQNEADSEWYGRTFVKERLGSDCVQPCCKAEHVCSSKCPNVRCVHLVWTSA